MKHLINKITHDLNQGSLEFELSQPRQSYSFEHSLNLGPDSDWMTGLTSLEKYNSIFNNTEEKETNSNSTQTILMS